MFIFFTFSRLGRTALANIDPKPCFFTFLNSVLIVTPPLPQNPSSRSPLLVSFHMTPAGTARVCKRTAELKRALEPTSPFLSAPEMREASVCNYAWVCGCNLT